MLQKLQRGVLAALVGVCGLVCAAGEAHAQSVDGRTTGIFFRVGPTVSGFDLGGVTFRTQGRHAATTTPSFTGKQLLLGREWLTGVSVGAHVDGPWFYVRVGADLFQNPTPGLSEFDVEATTLGFIAAGPRFTFGSFTVLGGLRVGALLLDVSRALPGERSQDYSALGAIYAVDLGAQWRPLRWLQVDVAAGQDFLGPMTATTFSVTANVGWSRAPAR